MSQPRVVPTQAFFRPGEPAALHVSGLDEGSVFTIEIYHLSELVAEIEGTAGSDVSLVTWSPSSVSGQGYGVVLRSEAGEARSAFDVLEHWTQMPRYGFLSEFRVDSPAGVVAPLLNYHINALQFYDWMWRHEELMPPEDPHTDLLGKESSMATVRRLIDEAHAVGIAAMPYSAVYAASSNRLRANPEWMLPDADGSPIPFGDNYLTIVDPDPSSAFGKHLLAELRRVLTETDFDGIHLDQYGHPKVGYRPDGSAYSLAGPITALIDSVAELVSDKRDTGAVVFNCVNNWPVESAAPSRQDITYIEVWEPHSSYEDVYRIITDAQRLGVGKPVVLAAYIDPTFEYSVAAFDALCFANGAGHIELGEGDALLGDPYFPKFGRMSVELSDELAKLYDFAVRYQQLTGPSTTAWESSPVEVTSDRDTIRTFTRLGDGVITVNLVEVPDGKWTARHERPDGKAHSTVRIGLDRPVERILAASPDAPELVELAFEQMEHEVTFSTPAWRLWQMIAIELGA